MRILLRYLLLFVGLIAAYVAFGLVASLMPQKAVEEHVKETVDQHDLQSDFWFAFLYKSTYYMDNFTDALIVNQAMTNGKTELNLWQRIMLVPRKNGGGEECESLKVLSEGNQAMQEYHYPRYWHGSTFLMRILLFFNDYLALRTFFYILSSLLLLWVLILLARRVGAWAAMIYCLALVSVNLFLMQHSIQFLTTLLLALVGSLWVLYRTKEGRQLAVLFFVLGSLTTYFDLLTCPLLTWGLPLLVWLVLGKKREDGRFSILTSLTWVIGYAATWATKWLLATVTTPVDVFADATGQAALRASVEEFDRWEAVTRNLEQVPWFYATIALGVLVLLAVRHFNRKGWRQALQCLVVALAPLVWFMALANHSGLHHWFTYRILAITVVGVLFAAASLVDWEHIKRKKEVKEEGVKETEVKELRQM